jgi:hypothetical protein
MRGVASIVADVHRLMQRGGSFLYPWENEEIARLSAMGLPSRLIGQQIGRHHRTVWGRTKLLRRPAMPDGDHHHTHSTKRCDDPLRSHPHGRALCHERRPHISTVATVPERTSPRAAAGLSQNGGTGTFAIGGSSPLSVCIEVVAGPRADQEATFPAVCTDAKRRIGTSGTDGGDHTGSYRSRTSSANVAAMRCTAGLGFTNTIGASCDAISRTRMPELAIHTTPEQLITMHPWRATYSMTVLANLATLVASILGGGSNTATIMSPRSRSRKRRGTG